MLECYGVYLDSLKMLIFYIHVLYFLLLNGFFLSYRHFLVVLVRSKTAQDHLEWCGLVESKVRHLVGNLEHNEHISLAHVNPRKFECSKQQLNTTGLCAMWFIGIEFKKMENLNVNLTENLQNFTHSVYKHANAINLRKDGMDIDVRHLRRKQLSTYLDKDILNRERKSMSANVTKKITKTISSPATSAAGNIKRTSSEATTQPHQSDSAQAIKRQRTNLLFF